MAWRHATFGALVGSVMCAAPVRAIIECSVNSATVRLPASGTPNCVTAGDFTVLAWVHPAALDPSPCSVVSFPGAFDLRLLGSGAGAWASVQRGGGNPAGAQVTASAAIVPGRWVMLMASWRRNTGTLTLHVLQDPATHAVGSTVSAALAGSGLGPVTGDPAIGASAVPGMVGGYGPIAVRDDDVTAGDAAMLFEARRFFGFYDTETWQVPGGGMNGQDHCVWMVNHAISTHPFTMLGGLVFDHAAWVGGPVTQQNYHVLDRGAAYLPESLRVARAVTAANGFTYRSHHEGAYAGFFGRELPGLGTSLDPVPAVAPLTRQLITGPRRPIRVMTSSNSRGIGWHDYSGNYPGNYASGFIERNRPWVSGVLLRPAHIGSGGSPWFGFDSKWNPPWQSGQGTVVGFAATNGPGDFARLFTGSETPTSRGPGEGVFLMPGAFYGLRCKPEPGSLVLATEPLVVQAHVLRFPGASPARWRWVKGITQNSAGTTGPEIGVALDTTTAVHPMGPGDSAPNPSTLVLAGDQTPVFAPGVSVFVAQGPGIRSFSVVTSSALSLGATTVTLSHPFMTPPAPGSVLKIGPWAFETITHQFPGLAPGDPEVFRGIELLTEPTGGGVAVFAYSAWRPGVPGLMFGTAGWGGNGYASQIAKSLPGSNLAWMAGTQADVWIEVPAQQDSQPSAMGEYASLIRAALPGVELVMAGEAVHSPTQTLTGQDPWGEYILTNAASFGAVGIASTEHPMLGSFVEQLADGLRADGYHFSQRGNQRQADAWTDMLRRGAIDPCLRADMNFDGVLTISDFGAFQTLFVAGDPVADMNGDGILTIADFGAFQAAFVLGC